MKLYLIPDRKTTYHQRLKNLLNTFPFGTLWPMSDTAGSYVLSLPDPANFSGSYHGDIALASIAGPSGKKVAHSDGSGIYVSLLAAPLITAWETHIKADPGIWTNGTGYVMQWLQADANNTIYLTKAVDGNIYWSVNRGGVIALPILGAYKPAGWFHLFLTWSETNNRVRCYLNGEKFYEAATGIWAGAPGSLLLYSLDTVTSWPGSLDSFVILGGREPTPAEVRRLVETATRIYRISIIGDSISMVLGNGAEWPWIVGYTHHNSQTIIKNHAEAAMGILAGAHNLAYQAAQAAGDDADAIIIALGTNDDNSAGNQAALQAALESGIDALKAGNPRAAIHTVKVWPNYAGAQHDNIRASIAAASAAKAIACHDPSTPAVWPTGDSADGWHPNAAGNLKAAAWVMGWL